MKKKIKYKNHRESKGFLADAIWMCCYKAKDMGKPDIMGVLELVKLEIAFDMFMEKGNK